jgi:4-carboxymuconolactone decarboxylase
MTEPRIAPVTAPYSPAITAAMARLLPADMAPPQIFLTFARNEGLFLKLVEGGVLGPTGLMDRRVLPPALREMVILRTCVAAGCDYEFNLHVQTISERMGLSAAQIADLRWPEPTPALWGAAELALMPLIDGLVLRREVSDAVYAPARQHHSEAALIEITHLVGLYAGVAMLAALARPQLDRYRG